MENFNENRVLTHFVTPDEGLQLAAETGDIDLANRCLAAGAAVNVPCAHYSPLMTAAHAGHADIVSLLLNKGANITATCVRWSYEAQDTVDALSLARGEKVFAILTRAYIELFYQDALAAKTYHSMPYKAWSAYREQRCSSESVRQYFIEQVDAEPDVDKKIMMIQSMLPIAGRHQNALSAYINDCQNAITVLQKILKQLHPKYALPKHEQASASSQIWTVLREIKPREQVSNVGQVSRPLT